VNCVARDLVILADSVSTNCVIVLPGTPPGANVLADPGALVGSRLLLVQGAAVWTCVPTLLLFGETTVMKNRVGGFPLEIYPCSGITTGVHHRPPLLSIMVLLATGAGLLCLALLPVSARSPVCREFPAFWPHREGFPPWRLCADLLENCRAQVHPGVWLALLVGPCVGHTRGSRSNGWQTGGSLVLPVLYERMCSHGTSPKRCFRVAETGCPLHSFCSAYWHHDALSPCQTRSCCADHCWSLVCGSCPGRNELWVFP